MSEERFSLVVMTVRRRPGRTEVALAGELDLSDAEAVDRALERLQRESPGLRLDLRALEFIDSSGARVLWSAHERAQEAGGDFLEVVVGPGAVRRVLTIVGFDEHLHIVEAGPPDAGAGPG